MLSVGRRYTGREIEWFRIRPPEIDEELEQYYLFKYIDDSLEINHITEIYLNHHINFVILYALMCEKDNKISKEYTNKIIEIIEGYCFAFDQGLFNINQLIQKLNVDVMQQKLGRANWCYIGVKNDFCE